LSWEIKINWDECPYLNVKSDLVKYYPDPDIAGEVCGHTRNKTHECRSKNCPIKK